MSVVTISSPRLITEIPQIGSRPSAAKRPALAELTPREREVLGLMAEGLSNLAIAEHIVVTESSVEKHVTSIFQKLHLPAAGDTHRRVLAVLTYLRTWPVDSGCGYPHLGHW